MLAPAVGDFFTLAEISRVSSDCFDAISHLHQKGLAHTDLKLEVNNPPTRPLPPPPYPAPTPPPLTPPSDPT